MVCLRVWQFWRGQWERCDDNRFHHGVTETRRKLKPRKCKLDSLGDSVVKNAIRIKD